MFDSQVKRKVSQRDYEEDLTFKSDLATHTKETQTRGTPQLTPVKPSVFPVPPLLNQKKIVSQNDKINQNNKIIQDILNGSKKQTGYNNSLGVNEAKQQPNQYQKIIPSNQQSKIKADIQNDFTELTELEEQISRRQSLHLQKDDTILLPRKLTQGQVQKTIFQNNQKQTATTLAVLPLDLQKQLTKPVQTPNKQRNECTLSTPKINSLAIPQINISAKVKDNESQQNIFSPNPSNTQNTNTQMILNSYLRTDDTFKTKPVSSSQTSRKSLCGSEISSMKNSMDIKTREKSFSSFRINDKVCLTQRHSISNQGNEFTPNQRLVSSSQNVRSGSQQHFFNTFNPTDNTEGTSRAVSTYYAQSTTTHSPQIQKTERESKQFIFKPSNMAKISNEYGNQFISSTSIQGAISQNSLRPKQNTQNQLDLSIAINGVGNQTEQIQTFKNTNQNILQSDLTITNMGATPNKQKKFAQSFCQLTKIVNTPDKSPTDSINMQKRYQIEDKIIKGIVLDKFQNQDDLLLTTQYENSLKKEVSSAFSDGPSTRQDVITMQKWLQNCLNQIQKMNSSKKVNHLSSVIELSCKELLRQISVECQERGELLQTVMRYQVFTYQEQIEQSRLNFIKFKKSSEDEYLKSHKVYEEIFQSKESEINYLKKDLDELRDKLNENIKQMEENTKNDKNLRQQLTRFKDLATYMKQRENESKLENSKLRSKINKVQNQNQRQSSVGKAIQKNFILLNDQEKKQEEKENKSHNTSINSDLFHIDENQQSEHLINIGPGGVSETIDKLNCVRFTNPDDIKKYEVIQTQTGGSLLLLNDMKEAEVQTNLENLVDEDYNSILQDKLTFDQFVYKVENMEAQVDYLKQREISLIEQLEAIKAEKNLAGDLSYYQQNQIFQVISPVMQVSTPQSRQSVDLDLTSQGSLMTPGRKKKIDEVDTVLTEKYKDSKNVSDQFSSGSSEDEDDLDSPLTQDERVAKKIKRQNLIKAVQKKTNNIRQLGEKINQIESIFNEVGLQIVEKIKKNKYHKFRNFMPLPTLLKQISLVYFERMRMVNENPRVREQEFSNFTYYFLTKLYGFKKIVDQKFIIFMLSIKKYINILRVNLFARFIGLLDNRTANFSLDEFNKYIEVLNYVFNIATAGQQPTPQENDSHYMIPFIRAMSFVGKILIIFITNKQLHNQIKGNFADTRMTFEENSEFRKEIEVLKENDSKGVHTAGLIDFDVFLNKMLAKYRQLVNRAKTYVINAFAASDLDGNGVCNINEFLILNRHIEVDIYDEDVLTQIFIENADRVIDNEQNLSFDKFAVVCVDYNLFSDEAQDKFLGIRHKREIDFKIQELQTEWVFRKRELKTIFEQLTQISQESKKKWLEIIDVLSEKLISIRQGEYKPLLIAYKILQNESKQLLSLEEEIRKDEELLNQYQQQAFKDQKEQQQNFQQLELSRISDSSTSSLQRQKKQRSGGSSSGIQQVLSIPTGSSQINLSGNQKKMSQYANQQQPTTSTSQVFSFNNAISPQSSLTHIPSGSIIFSNNSSLQNIEQNLKDANFIDLMLQKLKNVTNKEKFLVNILLKNGIEEPTENDIALIQDIILSLDSANNIDQQQNTKQLLFTFLMKQINSKSKKPLNQLNINQ